MKSTLSCVGSSSIVLLNRACFFVYWLNDNISILSQIGFLKFDTDAFRKRGMKFWVFALIFQLVQAFRQLKYANEQLEYYAGLVKESPEKKDSFKDSVGNMKKMKTEAIFNILKSIGDMFPALKGSGNFWV